MELKKDLIKVAFSNLIVLMASLVNGFILPSIMTLQGYADFRTYTLYASFIGFLHIGFVDGLNIKYGGENIKSIDFNEFDNYHSFFIVFQILTSIIMLAIGLLTGNIIIIFISLAIIPINLQSFFLFFYQAIGEFYEYSKSTIVVPVFTIAFTLLLLSLKISNYKWFVLAIIASYIISVVLLEWNYSKKRKQLKIKSSMSTYNNFLMPKQFIQGFTQFKKIFISGFYIMLGTVLFNLFFDTGRWVIKIFSTSDNFAIYSMAVSLIGFIVVFVSAVNKTFYPYLYKNNDGDNILRLKKILYVISSLSLPMFFLVKKIIERFIPKYLDSLPITAVLFLSIPAIFIVKSIYVNLYKVNKKERLFLIDTIKFLTIGFILTLILFKIEKSIIYVAIASLISVYIWALFPSGIKISIKNRSIEMLYILLIIGGFTIVYYFNLNFIISLIIDLTYTLLLNFVFYYGTMKKLLYLRK